MVKADDHARVVSSLSALAHEHRLALYRLLVERGLDGLPAGVIAECLGVPPSSLTFHLQQLLHTELVTQRRVSRQLVLRHRLQCNEPAGRLFDGKLLRNWHRLHACIPTRSQRNRPYRQGRSIMSVNAVNTPRLLGRWMRMVVIPNQSSIAKGYEQFNEIGRMLPFPITTVWSM